MYLDGKPTINVFPTWLETFWICIWSLIESGIVLYFKKPSVLVLITDLQFVLFLLSVSVFLKYKASEYHLLLQD